MTISARALPHAVEVHVDDEGPGLEPGTESRVFEKFYRGHVSQPGAGLGLAICRGVVEAHGGTLVAGRAPKSLAQTSAGARFTLTLVGQPPPPVPAEEVKP